MEKKEIKIDPNLFGYGGNSKTKSKSKKEKVKKDMLVNVNGKSVKELLLQKLKDYKKRKTSKNIRPEINENSSNQSINPDFLEKIKKRRQRMENSVMLHDNNFDNHVPPPNHVTRHVINQNQLLSTPQQHQPQQHQPYQHQHSVSRAEQPKYSNLKNGSMPTYRSFLQNKNRTMKNVVNHFNLPAKEERIELQIEKKLNVGLNKTKKKVGIFIKNSKLRKDIESKKLLMKKSHIKTVKSYLKNNNLIKHGSNAPSELLRHMYENSQLLGDVNNINSKNMIHNYMNDEEL